MLYPLDLSLELRKGHRCVKVEVAAVKFALVVVMVVFGFVRKRVITSGARSRQEVTS